MVLLRQVVPILLPFATWVDASLNPVPKVLPNLYLGGAEQESLPEPVPGPRQGLLLNSHHNLTTIGGPGSTTNTSTMTRPQSRLEVTP
jgi:hypothetical protein